MTIEKVDINLFLKYSSDIPILDVRSPSEYHHAHIPGALSLPLFNDEERKEIGTLYKQVSREAAIKAGLRSFGIKMESLVMQVEQWLGSKAKPSETWVRVHCWRGGMRSGAVAWLLSQYGYRVVLLDGGYKKYRRFVLRELDRPFMFHVLGGPTGSGKTPLLHQLRKKGMAVIDLEGLASHRGSAFGALGMDAQPTQEQFENNLHKALSVYYEVDEQDRFVQPVPIWIENESQRIGNINLPSPFWNRMQHAPCYVMDIPFEVRLKSIEMQYGIFEKEKLINAIVRITKKLGGQHAKQAVWHLMEDQIAESFSILLRYYDKQYERSGLQTDKTKFNVESDTVDPEKNALLLIQLQQTQT